MTVTFTRARHLCLMPRSQGEALQEAARLRYNRAFAHNPAIFRIPTLGVVDSLNGQSLWEFVRSGAEKSPLSVCTREPVREKRRCPDTAVRQKARSSRDPRTATCGRVRRTSRVRTWPSPADSPSHTRSY